MEQEKKRIMLTIAYDGTAYCGWQKQDNGITVEQVVCEALEKLLHEPVELIGCSRTDAGVHACGNVAVFDTVTHIPPDKLCYALNTGLPDDIVCTASKEVAPDFHPRRTSCRKTYEYSIYNAAFPLAIGRQYAYFVYRSIDIDAMREAAVALIGEHDFASFCSAGAQVKSTIRTIYSIEIESNPYAAGQMIVLRVCGNGFLYNMVRILAGTLLAVGLGNLTPEQMPQIIAAKDRQQAGPTCPAHGLQLKEIIFD